MPFLRSQLDLDRCPHCGIDRPTLTGVHNFETLDYKGARHRFWRIYQCSGCGGVVTAYADAGWDQQVTQCYPALPEVDAAVPERARSFLEQAHSSLRQPAGAVMLAASAVDAMLKAKDYKEGSLYSRIDKAAAEHVITADMAKWAHDVRLDANDQRHADEAVPLPGTEEAKRTVEFANALAQFMFVLPARVQRGLNAAGSGA